MEDTTDTQFSSTSFSFPTLSELSTLEMMRFIERIGVGSQGSLFMDQLKLAPTTNSQQVEIEEQLPVQSFHVWDSEESLDSPAVATNQIDSAFTSPVEADLKVKGTNAEQSSQNFLSPSEVSSSRLDIDKLKPQLSTVGRSNTWYKRSTLVFMPLLRNPKRTLTFESAQRRMSAFFTTRIGDKVQSDLEDSVFLPRGQFPVETGTRSIADAIDDSMKNVKSFEMPQEAEPNSAPAVQTSKVRRALYSMWLPTHQLKAKILSKFTSGRSGNALTEGFLIEKARASKVTL